MASALPENIHVLTLARHGDGDGILLRLENQFEKGEDVLLSQPTIVSLEVSRSQFAFKTECFCVCRSAVPLITTIKSTQTKPG